MPDPIPSAGAVFLSYAHEDAGAAQQIATALRAAGVEVWFDASELRGGDAWDSMIRRKIKECSLFLPVISGMTQGRREGYFRVEWKIAAQRTYAMADGTPFLMPVTIDATRDAEALVPPEFKAVQWTRLSGSDNISAFVARIRSLVGGSAPAAAPAAARAAATEPAGKSIAVLPLANSSPDPENAFFADGVHEDLLTNLAMIRELRVTSRTSVMQYRGTTKPIKQIGQELGVDYVLEGSVRRAGNKVRVTGQLIRASTDDHVWAKNYDRDITDVFELQSELARSIAGALQAVLSPQTAALIDRKPTENAAAYDDYLKARDIRNRSVTGSRTALIDTERLFTSAVQRDPNFAAAWGELAVVHALNVFWGIDATSARLAAGDAAIANAERSGADLPAVISSVGTYAYYARRDYARAVEQFEKLARLQPNDATVHHSLALIQRRRGQWAEALASGRRAVTLEPGNPSYIRNLKSTCLRARRWEDCRALQRRLVEMLPDSLFEKLQTADIEHDVTGSTREFEELIARLSPEERDSALAVCFRKSYAAERGDLAEFRRLDQLHPCCDELGARDEQPVSAALGYRSLGDTDAMKARIAPVRADLHVRILREQRNHLAHCLLALIEAMLGNAAEALRLINVAAALMPVEKDAMDGPMIRWFGAQVHAILGNKDEAIAELQWLFQRPVTNARMVSLNPSMVGLRGDPRFEALIADPANMAPLF